jgi:hypothetical protein
MTNRERGFGRSVGGADPAFGSMADQAFFDLIGDTFRMPIFDGPRGAISCSEFFGSRARACTNRALALIKIL